MKNEFFAGVKNNAKNIISKSENMKINKINLKKALKNL